MNEQQTSEVPTTDQPDSETIGYLDLSSETLDFGYKSCQQTAKQLFGPFLWIFSNTTGVERKSLYALVSHLTRVSDFLDIHTEEGICREAWKNYREEVRVAMTGKCRSAKLAALYDTAERYKIPTEQILSPLEAADLWMQNKELKTCEQFEKFTTLMGGAALAAVLPIFEIHGEPESWESIAIQGGKAIYQTLLLSLLAHDARQNQLFFPQSELEKHEVDLEKVKAGESDKSWRHFCRVQSSKIEPHLHAVGKLTYELEFDGQRAFKSLLAWTWTTLMKIKTSPESVLQEGGPLTKQENFKLKAKHWMGLEGGVAIIPTDAGHH